MISNIEENLRFNQFIMKALSLHLALLFVVFLLKTLVDFKILSFSDDLEKVEIIQTAVRIDVVGLPKMTLQELNQLDLIKGADPVEKTDVGKVNETSKVEFKTRKKVNLSHLLKKISNKNIAKKKRVKEKKIDQTLLKKLILEGNKVSSGSSATGQEVEKAQADFIQYIQSLPDKIKQFWKLPSYLLGKNLRCRLRIFIASDGRLLKIEIFESSGDKEFDERAVTSVKSASPFSKPSSNIIARLTAGEVILGFPL